MNKIGGFFCDDYMIESMCADADADVFVCVCEQREKERNG